MSGGGKIDFVPEKMETFAIFLSQMSSQFEKEQGQLTSRMQQLSNDWHDAAYQQFAQEFRQTTAALARLKQASDKYSAYLKKKAHLGKIARDA